MSHGSQRNRKSARGREPSEPTTTSYLHAHNEVAVCGTSGSGKTTLIARLIEVLCARHRIGYLKHGAHAFSMDREGKDTWRARQSGASSVFIADPEQYAYLGTGAIDDPLEALLWQDVDILLIEGNRYAPIPKVVVIDAEGEILDEVEKGSVVQVLAFVLRSSLSPELTVRASRIAASAGIGVEGRPFPPLIAAEDVAAASRVVLDFLEARATATPLYGLVLGGGLSTRMKRDKSAIEYHGIPQARYAHALLERVCSRTFVSVRSEQADLPVFAGLGLIHDRFLDMGPIGGILSALHVHPQAAWLVLGCDLPFVTAETLEHLAAERDPLRLATCFDASGDGLPEPVCAIYEPAMRTRLMQLIAIERESPRAALINSRTKRIPLLDEHALDNVNSPEEMESALARLQAASAKTKRR